MNTFGMSAERPIVLAAQDIELGYPRAGHAMNTVLRDFSPRIEVYSIDESFLQLEGLGGQWRNWITLGQVIRRRVLMWTGLPV